MIFILLVWCCFYICAVIVCSEQKCCNTKPTKLQGKAIVLRCDLCDKKFIFLDHKTKEASCNELVNHFNECHNGRDY